MRSDYSLSERQIDRLLVTHLSTPKKVKLYNHITDTMGSQELTQANSLFTQPQNSHGNDRHDDISDILCILHPCSAASLRITAHAEAYTSDYVLHRPTSKARERKALESSASHVTIQSQQGREDTSFASSSTTSSSPVDIVLKFSAIMKSPASGFLFGRNADSCDIDLSAGAAAKRISGQHFRIFVNVEGVLMLEDTSTNGTIVDTCTVGGKRILNNPKTRILIGGSIIEILSPAPDEFIKFIVHIPPRDTYLDRYIENYQKFMNRAAYDQQLVIKDNPVARDLIGASFLGHMKPQRYNMVAPSATNHGMSWDGGSKYKCIGVLGKGAFAMVYQVACKTTGEVFAAKEMEKQRFVRNGVLDRRIDNEMKIMQGLVHPHIVQFIDFIATPSTIVILMEHVAGGDLQKFMEVYHFLPEDLAKTMTPQVLYALDYLHKRNVTHRDIKPDNILVASYQPFRVKLTDFGLSKMVKNNETFLKTFCGTLLYCAPEVFPHYDAFVNSVRPKRSRHGSPQTSRSYNQMIDIWSFGAVLWFLLCGKPPFAGVVDSTGQGMFQNIMTSKLDVRPLQERAISELAIDLLKRMLNTEPLSRPDELECMQHPWLSEERPSSASTEAIGTDDVSNPLTTEANWALSAIYEEDELDASQLKITDAGSDDAKPDSQEQSFGKERRPKRQKGDHSSCAAHLNLPQASFDGCDDRLARAPGAATEGRTTSIRNSNHAVPISVEHHGGSEHHVDLPLVRHNTIQSNTSEVMNQVYEDQPILHEMSGGGSLPTQRVDSVAGSLSGAESLVRDMRMASPGDGATGTLSAQGVQRHTTPDTPRAPTSWNQAHRGGPMSASPEEVTPKAPSNRRINLAIRASSFYDPHDISTHNIAYARRVSGIDFSAEQTGPGLSSLPATALNSLRSSMREPRSPLDKPAVRPAASTILVTDAGADAATTTPSLGPALSFARPAPRLGRLTSTASSFAVVTIALTQRITTFGRLPDCTVVYGETSDTRVAKCALEIWFHAPRQCATRSTSEPASATSSSVEESESQSAMAPGGDWASRADLAAFVLTRARSGVRVNGVLLRERDERGRRLWGRLRSGDEVVVYGGKGGASAAGRQAEELRLVCEFWRGAAAKARGAGEKFEVECEE